MFDNILQKNFDSKRIVVLSYAGHFVKFYNYLARDPCYNVSRVKGAYGALNH